MYLVGFVFYLKFAILLAHFIFINHNKYLKSFNHFSLEFLFAILN